MSTKSLKIVIIVLAIVDIVAGFWYLDGRLNDNGHAPLSFSFGNDSAAVEASTIAEPVQSDEFSTVGGNAFFVTDKPVDIAGTSHQLSSAMRIMAKWPQKINGIAAPQELTQPLLQAMFGPDCSQTEISGAINAQLSKPVFSIPTSEPYSKTATAPAVIELFGHVQSVKAYPVMNSTRLLVYAIEKKSFGDDNAKTSAKTNHVVFDRINAKVITVNDMIAADKCNGVLALINRKIDKINGDAHRFDHPKSLPSNVFAKHKGLQFHFTAGELGSDEADIYIDYAALKPMLTASFNDIVSSNSNFVDYNPISFKK